MEFFSDENFIEPLMEHYKDFNYVKHILSLPIKSGLKLYLKCLDRENNSKTWDIFLIDRQLGYKGSFEEYSKFIKNQSITNNMTPKEKDNEEERIIKKIEKAEKEKKVKLKERKFLL